ncbi:Asp-tRNA(Asn)/Glu-tRNA(Gln) amidotransferase subunit GatA [Gleimia hominis]|uniref:Glutamyl-tRNA(Gln) amidotransferase subunit A n=1 Tax=Gleimia hominis TaxID=595468 RepID=A0ABU3IEW0_9ACTO|nr:Asp-tRNA(Asn)/Glu-tRNA(Gln) amidotransferase subunit GatA [Gleimia hominis]MDT3767780.1 Asp-tRNA(Asn)/Glu-tRNA(Gln) amidotransferase subunit GatA [Gleimia hominis]
MTDVLLKTATQMAQMLRDGEITSEELTQACLDRIERFDGKIHAFLFVNREGALATARQVDAARERGEELPAFAGVPIALKDNIVTRGMPTTCASKMLEGWIPPYDATVVKRVQAAMMPILGKTNMDEFAMGSTTATSAFGRTGNPWDPERIPGGSGGGSAAAVAAYMAPLALGSDTGGSIRQPGSVTGTVGAKPTYGAVSRYGLVAMASSLDQIGPVARSVADAAALQDIVGGHDPLDSTSLNDMPQSMAEAVANRGEDLSGLRIGVVKQMTGEGYERGVIDAFNAGVEALKARGAQIVEVDCTSFEYALAAYYLIMPAEASSNLARFDGVRFGLRVLPEDGPVTAERMMSATREAGFGDEVKRRIILGTHVLSAGYFDAYYGNAQKVRTLVQRDFAAAFEKVDVLATPTSPTTAFRFDDKPQDLMSMYLNDIATIPANLAGVPGVSVPVGLSDGLPVGLQVLAPARKDELMYKVASFVQDFADVEPHNPAAQW